MTTDSQIPNQSHTQSHTRYAIPPFPATGSPSTLYLTWLFQTLYVFAYICVMSLQTAIQSATSPTTGESTETSTTQSQLKECIDMVVKVWRPALNGGWEGMDEPRMQSFQNIEWPDGTDGFLSDIGRQQVIKT